IRMSVGRPRWTSPPTCSIVCWTWDARPTSASPNPGRGWGQCVHSPDPCTTLALTPLADGLGRYPIAAGQHARGLGGAGDLGADSRGGAGFWVDRGHQDLLG